MDYTLMEADGAVTRTSREDLVYHAVDRDEITENATRCGLTLARVLGDFDGAQAGREVIYVFTR
jgi:hypothetical protein